jgi:hypothetical protein
MRTSLSSLPSAAQASLDRPLASGPRAPADGPRGSRRPVSRLRASPAPLCALAALAALALLLCSALPAHAQRMVRGGGYSSGDDHRGIYLALGGGIGLQLPSPGAGLSSPQFADNALGWLGEARVGFSLTRSFQIFVSYDTGGASQPAGFLQASNVLAALRWFVWHDESIGVYFRGGLGIGWVSYPDYPKLSGAPTLGLAEAGGLGMEFRLDKNWSLTPEVFYRRTNESSVYRADLIGFGMLVNFN